MPLRSVVRYFAQKRIFQRIWRTYGIFFLPFVQTSTGHFRVSSVCQWQNCTIWHTYRNLLPLTAVICSGRRQGLNVFCVPTVAVSTTCMLTGISCIVTSVCLSTLQQCIALNNGAVTNTFTLQVPRSCIMFYIYIHIYICVCLFIYIRMYVHMHVCMWLRPRPGRFTMGKTWYPLYRRLGEPHNRSGLERKSRPHRDSIPGPSRP